MKVLITKKLLEEIVSNTSSYLDKKDLSSITSHLLMSAKDGIFSIKATDHEIGLSYNLQNVSIETEGEATANGGKLLSVIKGLSDDNVTLETVNGALFVKQKKSKYKLPMFETRDFPSFPTVEGKNSFDVNAGILGRSLKKIYPSIDTNNPKYELNGALIDVKEGFLNLVGTDTKRLSVYKLITQSKAGELDTKILIPKKAIGEIQKLFSDKIKIYYDENVLLAVSENFEFFTKLINGKFPNYERVIPSDTAYKISIPRDKMVSGVRAINAMCEEMKVTIKKDGMVFESINEDNSEAKTEIEAAIEINSEIVFGVKNRFLLDFLSSIESEIFELNFNSSDTAFVLSADGLKTVVMPINNI